MMNLQKATRQHTKEHNLNLVLRLIYEHESISRAEIARLTSLTRTTVSEIVAGLMEFGLVAESGTGESLGGKPPIQVRLVENARQLLCLDVSNDDFQGALINLRGEIQQRAILPLHHRTGDEALSVVYQLIDDLLAQATAPIVGIGIGTPGLVDTRQGVVKQSVNRGWFNLPLKELLETRYHLPISIANDSHIAALAEYTYGEQRHIPNLVVIKVGEGIGSGIVLGGQIHYGDGFSAGEIGHLSVVKDGPLCTCGNRGCLEAVASSRALISDAQELIRSNPGMPLARLVGDDELTIEHLEHAYQNGDEHVLRLVADAGTYLGAAIANLAGVLNIRKIILAGMPAFFGDEMLVAARVEMRRKVLPAMVDETELSISLLGDDIVMQGASALVLSEELGLP